MIDSISANNPGNIEDLINAPEIEREKDLYKSDDMGKDEFLKLLITSLQHQDPMSPTSNEDFIAQMAQFSSLENSKNMVSSIDKLAASMEDMIANQKESANTISSASATSLLGKKVRVSADTVLYNGKDPLSVKVHVNDGETALISVVDGEENVVNTIAIGKSGDSTFTWDGSKPDGEKASPGDYTVKVTNFDGTRDVGYTYVENKVDGVSYENGGVMLDIDGQTKPFEDIMYVTEDTDGESGD
ncbi:MAG: hypothetical protein HQK83_10100 [Fibrobacteria bacterium]|nr:hypothetical protein [Fibrobacteria bacterium]